MYQAVYVDCLASGHTHLREGEEIIEPLIHWAIQGGADILGPQPNTVKGLLTAREVIDYNRILKRLVPKNMIVHFIPFVMITEDTTEEEIDLCVEAGIMDGKIYPKDRTTQSGIGVKRYGRMLPKVKHCGKAGMRVHPHPEHPSPDFNNRDAEYAFLQIMYEWLEETDAIIVSEHGTDGRCIPHWMKFAETGRFFVTLTGHHLAANEDNVFGEVDAVCKPPIKTEQDRQQLISLVNLNLPWVLGALDDAFHDISKKHVPSGRCNCGAYTAPFGLELYAHALDHLMHTPEGLQTFVNFTSRNTRRLYNLPASSRKIKLVRTPWNIPLAYPVWKQTALPFWAGQTLNWRIVG